MKIQKFEDIIGWQKAQDLAIEIYGKFGSIKNFSFKDQICRAVVSISNNIAEGFDRQSNKEFKRFLHIAKGSCSEVKSMVYLGKRLGYINDFDKQNLLNKCSEISKILRGLIKSLNCD